jgi:hypothetical protein
MKVLKKKFDTLIKSISNARENSFFFQTLRKIKNVYRNGFFWCLIVANNQNFITLRALNHTVYFSNLKKKKKSASFGYLR